MQEDTQQALEHLINEGQRLLDRYHESKEALNNPSTDLSATFWSEVAGAVAGDLFESARLGSELRKFSRSSLKTNRKSKMKELESYLTRQADSWTSGVSKLLAQVSTPTSSNTPNSQKLLSKFSRVERYIRPDTKLRNGIAILKEMALRGVVRNEDLVKSRLQGLVAKPGEQFKAYNQIMEIASKTVGFLIVIDPYPSQETLIVLEKSPNKLPTMLLTSPPKKGKDRAAFEVLARKLKADRPEIEIRYAPSQTLHDRFIITETESWHIGHSIKDIGNRLSAITPMGSDGIKRLKEEFDSIWNQSIPV